MQNTKDETLAILEEKDSVIRKIREFRALQKLVTSNSKKLLSFVSEDGRIRSDWKIHGAITGRMSCSNPNIQQMDRRLRPFFKAQEGHVFVDCDYSQIELRVAAQISGDIEMINGFKNNEDLQIKTAQMIFDKSDISKEERQIAKTCNFGLIYGMSANGLKARLKETCDKDVTIREAEKFKKRFLKLYKGIKKWQLNTSKKSKISTLGGKQWRSQELTYLEKYNYPIQGSAAEGLKEAMAIIIREIPDYWKICAVIHDEVLLEVPRADEEEAKKKLEQWMVEGMSKIVRDVPIVAEASSSATWEKL